MSFILNIETATKNCSVAIAKDGHNLALCEIATDSYSHAEKLHVFVQNAVRDAGIEFKDLSAVAISKGPGSYTGLRIGVSAAKGYCFALNIPLISVGTLEILANQLPINQGVVIPMIDARRMEVYSAIFEPGAKLVRGVSAEIINGGSFSEIEQTIHVIGDCQEKIKSVLNRENVVYHENVVYPSAKQMAAMSFERFKSRAFEDLAYFEPFYLKDFIVGAKSQ